MNQILQRASLRCSQERFDSPEIFAGYKCKHCGVIPIKGVLYSCPQCPDYFLCEQCEPLSLHEKHMMLKIRKQGQLKQPAQIPVVLANPGEEKKYRAISVEVKKESGKLVVFPGENFKYGWEMKNIGQHAWPVDTQLILSGSEPEINW